MKYLPILLATTICLSLSAQEKGATPLAQSSIVNPKSSTTRAVVVGISDYQHPAIPDLRFPDRDAEAFANFLHSLPIMLFTVGPFHRLIIQKSYKPDYLFNFNIALTATCTILRIKYHEP
jgi:hypothetical protein